MGYETVYWLESGVKMYFGGLATIPREGCLKHDCLEVMQSEIFIMETMKKKLNRATKY